MQKIVKRLVLVTLVLVMSLMGAVPCLAAATSPKIKVAMLEYPNYIDWDENGDPWGFACDYLKKISNYTGWEYEYIPMSFTEAETALEKGEIDLLPGSQYTEERNERYDYGQYSMTNNANVLCVKLEDNRYYFNDYASFQGMKIGVLDGSVRAAQLQTLLDEKKVTVTFCPFETDDQQKEALNAGKVDAILMASTRCTSDYKIISSSNPAEVYFTCNPLNPAIKEGLDAAQEQILSQNPYYNEKLYEKYYGSIPTAYAFTEAERAYMKDAPALTVAISQDMKPYEYYDEGSGEYGGLVVDYFKKITEITGMAFNYVKRGGEGQLTEAINAGEVQLVASIATNGGAEDTYPITLTDPYYRGSVDLTKNRYVTDALSSDNTVVLLNGFPRYEELVKQYGYKTVLYGDTLAKCVQMVDNGQADVTFLPAYSSGRLTGHAYYRNLITQSIQHSDFDCAIGVATTCDAKVVSILNKALSAVTEKEKTAIFVAAMNNNTDPMTIMDFFYNNLIIILVVIIIFLACAGILLVNINIRRKKQDMMMTEAKRNAEEANAAKTDFLSRMSHDMRTPMNGIMGLTALTRDIPKLPEEAKDNLEAIDQSSHYLLNLINDVLDMNRIESKKIVLTPEEVPLDTLVQSISAICVPLAQEKEITLTFTPINLALEEATVCIDKIRMEQIIINIVSNAVKFTPAGGRITVEVECLQRIENRSACKITVADNGIGISDEFLPHLFEPFEQEKTEITPNNTGTGLGLAIVKNLVELMGGTISVKSKLGQGTQFTILMEVERKNTPGMAEESKPVATSLAGKHLLLAEDHPLNAQIAIRLLEKKGLVVDHAENGKAAVDRFSQSPVDYYQGILMDIRMPVMNGLEAAQAIRKLERRDGKSIPIIAMTANAFDEDVEASHAAGMNAHLAKPIEPKRLYEALNTYLNP